MLLVILYIMCMVLKCRYYRFYCCLAVCVVHHAAREKLYYMYETLASIFP